jgi:thiamine biosynthesis lipoprotein
MLGYFPQLRTVQQPTLILDKFQALGTLWYLEVFDKIDPEQLPEIKEKVESLILTFQKKYSRFAPDSLLNDLNYDKSVDFDSDLWEMLQLGESFHKDSSQIFDLFIKRNLESKGYGKKIDRVEADLEVDENEGRFFKKGEKIFLNTSEQVDLGGIGKGYLIDKLARFLQIELGLKYFLINGGGDLYATSDHEKPVKVLLEHPTDQSLAIGEVELLNQSLCVSSSFKRVWQKDGRTANHFISASDKEIQAASYVLGSEATSTDVLATILCLFGNDELAVGEILTKYRSNGLVLNELGQVLFASPDLAELLYK